MKQLTEHKIIKALPLDNNCFATYEGPCEGVGLRMFVTEDDYVVGLCKTKKCHQGYGDIIHGGIIGTYFDEVLWYATTVPDDNLLSMTVEMNVKYLSPLPVEEEIRIIAEPMRREGRHLYADGFILKADDEVAATATAHFIVAKEDHQVHENDVYETMELSKDEIPETVKF